MKQNLVSKNVPKPVAYVRQAQIPPGEIKQRHLEANTHVIVFGLSADRPDGSTITKAYFASDTGVLSLWDGSSWLETTLS